MEKRIFLLLLYTILVHSQAPCTKCPSGGIWSDWSDYTSCTATCGLFGQKIQTRLCSSWDYGCPCTGAYSRKTPCPETACLGSGATCAPSYVKMSIGGNRFICGNVSQSNDYQPPSCSLNSVLATCPCPKGGVWSTWTSQGSCSATCGLCGTVNQKRTCKSKQFGCPCSGTSTRTVQCPNKPCPGSVCCKGKLVKNLKSGANQCGLVFPADQTLSLASCQTTTTTTTTSTTTTTTTATTTTTTTTISTTTTTTTTTSTSTTTTTTTTTLRLCDRCSMSTPEILPRDDWNIIYPFASDFLYGRNRFGCLIRVVTCVSVENWHSAVQFDDQIAILGAGAVSAMLVCGADGIHWTWVTENGTSIIQSSLSCAAINCENGTDLPPCYLA